MASQQLLTFNTLPQTLPWALALLVAIQRFSVASSGPTCGTFLGAPLDDGTR